MSQLLIYMYSKFLKHKYQSEPGKNASKGQ